MEYRKGYYSLIQFCPDPSRLEAVNIGVLLFCPELQFLRPRLSRSNDRIRRFFGHQDWSLIKAQKDAIAGRLEVELGRFRTLDDLQDYITRRANNVQITPTRPMKVRDPAADLERLFEELIGEAELIGETEGHSLTPRVTTMLKREFVKAQVEKLVEQKIAVMVPDTDKEIVAPYAYRNGALNLILPVNFEAPEFDSTFAKAATHAIEGELLWKHSQTTSGPTRLVVVGVFGLQRRNDLPVVRNILESHDTALYCMDDLAPLIQEIRTSAAHHRLV